MSTYPFILHDDDEQQQKSNKDFSGSAEADQLFLQKVLNL